MMSAINDPRTLNASGSMGKVSEDALIGEMKGGRGKIFAAIAIGVAIIAILVYMGVR